MGAATAIFSVIDNVLRAPFPYPGAAGLVFPPIHGAQRSRDDGRQGYTPSEVLEFAENNRVLRAPSLPRRIWCSVGFLSDTHGARSYFPVQNACSKERFKAR